MQERCLESVSAALALLTVPREDTCIKIIYVARNVVELNLPQLRMLTTKEIIEGISLRTELLMLAWSLNS